jgi:S1-C subfamily serine protease
VTGTTRLLVAGLSLIAAASCAASSPSASPERAQRPDELRMSGVGIVAEGCGLTAQLGSGVVVGRPEQVVTVAHTIAGATAITVVDATGHEHTATVRAFDKDRDLAVLSVADLEAPALDLAPAVAGTGATLAWSRDGGVEYDAIEVTKRLAVTIEDIYVEDTVERAGLELAGEIRVGDSGGPVLSSTGDVIGIIYANSRSRDGVGFATDSSELASVLQSTSNSVVDNGRCG